MFIIQKTTKAGTAFTGIECETIGEAKARCNELTEGKAPTTDDADDYFRLEVCEVMPDGNLEQAYVTDFYEE